MGNLFLKACLIVLTIVLYGTAPRSGILIVFAAIFLWRVWPLRHAWEKALSPHEQEALEKCYQAELQHATKDQLVPLREELQLNSDADIPTIARALVSTEVKQCKAHASRAKFELKLLPFSLIAFPAAVTLAVSEIVVMKAHYDWGALLIMGSALAAHLIILRIAKPYASIAAKLAFAISIISVIAVPALVLTRHPYLNPFAENRSQLISDHVLGLKNNVVAGSHADYVFGYANELQIEGRLEDAVHYYLRGLYLDAENYEGHLAIAKVFRALKQFNRARSHEASAQSIRLGSRTVAFSTDQDSPTLDVIGDIEADKYLVILVPVGTANRDLIEAAGSLVTKSLKHPVFLSTATLDLPPADRKRGLLVAPQHSTSSIYSSFLEKPPFQHTGPVQIVLITDADVYMENTNFVFATSWYKDHVSVVSYNRFKSPDSNTLVSRLAKQILSSSIKAMRVPQANTLDCVTAYVDSRDQFDRKSIHLSPQTRRNYELRIKAFEKGQKTNQRLVN
ncbi:MAG: hypothetical protein ACSHYA_13895 [Opitutaceae bacterium]